MIATKVLLSASVSFVRKAAGQVATSVAAALCVALVTNAVMKKDAPAPAAPPVLVFAPAPSGLVPTSPQPTAAPASFTISGAFPMQAEMAHGFPMEGDPGFQASLSRPFTALAGADWAEPKVEYTVMAADEGVARRKSRPQSVAAKAPKAPVAQTVATLAAAEPAAVVAQASATQADDGMRIFGFKAPRILPNVDDVVGGVSAAAASLTKLARFQ